VALNEKTHRQVRFWRWVGNFCLPASRFSRRPKRW
jgi:hypothetical protein